MRSEEYNLMRFEGCGKVLFNTIILSGPNIEELKELKRLMKIITKNARYLYCQKFILKYFNMYYEPSIFGNSSSDKKTDQKKRKKTIHKAENYISGFDTEILNDKLNEFECIFMNMHNKNKNDILNVLSRVTIGTIAEIERNPISQKESHVLKSVPSQCLTCSYTMNAYSTSEDEEKTLGQNIFSFLEEAKEKCEKCGDIKLNHTSFIYKNNGRIKISLFNLNEVLNQIDKVAEFLGFNISSQIKESSSKKIGENNCANEDEIFSYGYCEKCFKIVTPIVKLPKEILNFSATKFYQNILYNKKLINFGDKNIMNFPSDNKNDDESNNCQKQKHLHYKDISRIFITKNGVIKFQYEDVIKYKLLGSQLTVKNDYYIDYNKATKIKTMALD